MSLQVNSILDTSLDSRTFYFLPRRTLRKALWSWYLDSAHSSSLNSLCMWHGKALMSRKVTSLLSHDRPAKICIFNSFPVRCPIYLSSADISRIVRVMLNEVGTMSDSIRCSFHDSMWDFAYRDFAMRLSFMSECLNVTYEWKWSISGILSSMRRRDADVRVFIRLH